MDPEQAEKVPSAISCGPACGCCGRRSIASPPGSWTPRIGSDKSSRSSLGLSWPKWTTAKVTAPE